MTQIDEERIARLAGEAAARKVFAILGVDLDDPRQVEDFRKDLRVAGQMRSMMDRGWSAAVGVVVVGLCAVVWIGIQTKLMGK